MAERNDKAIQGKTQLQLTQFYDEFSEVMALNHFFYEAIELIYKDLTQEPGRYDNTGELGLILLIRYLRQREQALKQHLEAIRSGAAA